MKTANRHYDIVSIPLPTPFPIGPVNCYLLTTAPPMLIDTGPNGEAAYERLAQGLKDRGLAPGDLGAILITHGHLDHVGLLARLLQESGAPAYSHPYVVAQWRSFEEDAEATKAFYGTLFREFGVPGELVDEVVALRDAYRSFGAAVRVDHALSDGERVGPLRAWYVPGHSPSDTLFVDEARRIAFSGDHLLKDINPNPLVRRPLPGQPRPKSLVEYQESLQRTRAIDIATCYPGHGAPFGGVRAVVDRLLGRHERRTQVVLRFVESEPLSPYQVSLRLFPKLGVQMLHMGLSVAIGHLEVLEERGDVAATTRDGICYYRRRYV